MDERSLPANRTLKVFEKYPPESTVSSKDVQTHDTFSGIFYNDYVNNVPEAYVDSTSSFKKFMSNINWLLDQNKSRAVFLIGPTRSGTSAAMRHLKYLTNIEQEDYVKYFDYEESSVIDSDYPSHVDEKLSSLDNWWTNTDFSETKIILMDNLPVGIFNWFENISEPLDDLKSRSNHDEILVIISMNKMMLSYLRDKSLDYEPTVFGMVPDIIHFQRAKRHEIKDMLKRRMNANGQQRSRPFTDSIIEIICNLSLGLPGLALWLCRSALKFQKRWDKPDQFINFIEHIGLFSSLKLIRTISSDGSAIFGVDTWPFLQILQKIKISQTKSQKLISETGTINYLTQYLTNNKKRLISDFNHPYASIRVELLKKIAVTSIETDLVPRSTLKPLFVIEKEGETSNVEKVQESKLTYHTQKLIHERAIKLWKSGKETLYSLRSPMKEAVEFALFP